MKFTILSYIVLSGKMIHGTVAHVEAISCLAIDPNGLYLLSGSHDGSLRLWNMEKRICLQVLILHELRAGSFLFIRII